eukprot:scaffold69980_cov73-Phaeocystis_antarctica.AAC.1
MAQRVLAQASDLVAAVACFSGLLALSNDLGVFPLTELSSEYTPRPLMVIHGNADLRVPYDPTPASDPTSTYDPTSAAHAPYLDLGAEGNLALWGGYNGCPGDAAIKTPNDNYTLHEINCNGVVSALVEVTGVGHYPLYDVGGVVSGFSFYDGLGTAPQRPPTARPAASPSTRASPNGASCSLGRSGPSARRAASLRRLPARRSRVSCALTSGRTPGDKVEWAVCGAQSVSIGVSIYVRVLVLPDGARRTAQATPALQESFRDTSDTKPLQ